MTLPAGHGQEASRRLLCPAEEIVEQKLVWDTSAVNVGDQFGKENPLRVFGSVRRQVR